MFYYKNCDFERTNIVIDKPIYKSNIALYW